MTVSQDEPRRPGERRPGIRDLGPVNFVIERIGARVQGKRTLGVFATVGRAKNLFKAWLPYSATMMPFGDLSRKETELVILRVAALKGGSGGEYEADHHRAIGRKAGLIDGDLVAVARVDEGWEPGTHGFHGRTGAMIDVTDEIVRFGEVSHAAWGRLTDYLDDRECVALVMLVTNYSGLATALSVLHTPLDEKR
jgi:alkylhydroperoxidase family enzyme